MLESPTLNYIIHKHESAIKSTKEQRLQFCALVKQWGTKALRMCTSP